MHSPGYSDMSNISYLVTKKCNEKFQSNTKEKRSSATNTEKTTQPKIQKNVLKKKRLRNCNISDFMTKSNIRKESELMQAALQRSKNGEKDLQVFILNKSPKDLFDLIATTWKIQAVPETVACEHCSRISINRNHATGKCAANCQGEWLKCEKEVLQNNKTNVFFFAFALKNVFVRGRQKSTNILIVGPTNYGKSFLLNPIELMFKAFVNPATGRYAWVGIDECEVTYLNDFKWSTEIIAWSDFLLLLKDQTMNFSQPKNQYASDICIQRKNTIPFFAISKKPIEFIGKYNIRDKKEPAMMPSS